ncbi:hypothetical protein GQ43DRAFT_482902 [Delitschia confertaspora ATCC 74209]|uniref:Alb1-domain-containing protein n=1 Tax=Delitschia confertaspora ATCC 74209 TaxID=1513339 RepID=A0A9P4JLG8_9PLEO|nr:hypothetical protein GQ43DRAFT_482902 [Delitschia confertaspora ATCC 74209]
MAKTAKLKKKAAITASVHSRAARRAVSPSIDLDKSLKNLPRPESPSSASKAKSANPRVLTAQPTGVTKRNKSKPLKRAQRLRQIKAMERAADDMDKLEVKVKKSVTKEKTVKERSKAWEDVNGRRKNEKSVNPFGALEESEGGEGREWVSDEEMPEVGGVVGEEPEISGAIAQVVVAESAPLPVAPAAVEDEFL